VFPATSVYGATKAAVRHLGKALAREWARRGISVNVIQPGYFESEMTAALFESEVGAQMVKSFPRQRMRPPSDLHAPLLMLCSDAALGITGTVITVDDGQTL
jgi:NAD(P)-dependent dehydrogenase (short-subunit alcohol dehydrogenase family)